jgi:hypothetical protein
MLQYDTTSSEPAQVLDLVEVVGTSVASNSLSKRFASIRYLSKSLATFPAGI